MRNSEGSTLTALRGIQQFIAAHADAMPAVAASGKRADLDALVTELEGHAQNQTGHDVAARGATRTKAALMRSLIEDHMRPIARLAAADAPTVPALAAFQLPKGSVPDEVLLDRARGMAEEAANYADRFIADGLPATFVNDLYAAVDAVRATIDRRKTSAGSRVQATTALGSRIRTAKRVVRALDALVRKHVKDDAFLANWNSVKKVVIVSARTTTASAPPAGTSASPTGASTSPTGTSAGPTGTSASPSDAPTSSPVPTAAAA